jgi:hypothetical protein
MSRSSHLLAVRHPLRSSGFVAALSVLPEGLRARAMVFDALERLPSQVLLPSRARLIGGTKLICTR